MENEIEKENEEDVVDEVKKENKTLRMKWKRKTRRMWRTR